MRIGVIGNGRVGRTLAEGWAAVGHDVRLGSRDPGRGVAGSVPVVGLAEAAESAEVVVNATPGAHSVSLLGAEPAGWLDGTVLLDVSNADDGAGALVYPDGSLAERLQAAFPAARVVKSLSTFSRTVMVDPGILPKPTTVFLSGDDPEAKRVVATLLEDLGWAPEQLLDLGGLLTARAVEHMIGMYYAIRDAVGTRDFNVAVVWNRRWEKEES
ncbi:NADPH-dependent F420 reductase [Microbacterium ulmi]|uniref:NAD(P)-binding domain-containing protein n=1 Tax=Microbacterium ulmi TaxID=179095 RepID=A0A7Y2Q302_9MICO|nr:NAD(P)-binding domain-containing protein [Microbacterium ulmi]NII70525.1 hypothetical protein [Microbacterium ulmi]NNH05203.1 NAD(P)-binding domain-containing protein [Microbacterium ulmi]